MIETDWDVIVVGGGPAGSTAATLTARQGRRVLLLDRERFPRFQIGESLIPATYWSLERLGLLDALRESAFPRKYSVQFLSRTGHWSTPFYFRNVDPHESSVTWQVDRATFDRMLLDHARDNGVAVQQPVTVGEVLFDGTVARGVRAEFEDGTRQELYARVVVDASGQAGVVSRQLSLKIDDPELKHSAYFTRFKGAWRGPGIDAGATLVIATATRRSWFWYIPLPDDEVSVGVVGPVADLRRGRDGGPQHVFDEEVRGCPALAEKIAGTEQCFEVRVRRDWSYVSKRIAGDGWILAGDAFGFLDPLYSTGVFLALKAAEHAADAIAAAWVENDFSGAVLGRHGERFLDGMEALRKLVYAYYDERFSVRRFVDRYPQHKDTVTHTLMGNVFRVDVNGMFEDMARECELPETRRLEPCAVPSPGAVGTP